MSKEYRHLGKATPRLAAREFVTGKAKYVRDLKLPHMLYGKVLRSPHPHANIKSIDTSRAEMLPGVKVILTHKNTPDWYLGMPIPHARVLDNKVRFVGDAVALVAAEAEDIAEAAVDLIKVEYEPLPAVFDIEEALNPDAPQLYAHFPGNLVPKKLIPHITEVDSGDTEKGFREADIIAEGTTRLENAQNPLTPEAPAAIALWEDGKLTLWGQFNAIGLAAMGVRAATGLAAGDLRLVSAFVGGSYGSRSGVSHIMFYAAALSRAARRPVSLALTREEHFATYLVRLGCRGHYKVGMKKDGTVTAIAGEWLANCGGFASLQGDMIAVGLGGLPMVARCSNLRVNTKIVLTNTIPSGAFRGFGYLEHIAMLSPILTVAMEKANLDPVEYYKKNCIKPDDRYLHPYMGIGFEVSAAPDPTSVIEKGAELFGWKNRWKGWGQPSAIHGTKRRGVGIGVAGESDVGEQASNQIVQLNAFGSVTVYCCATEFGTGTRDVIRKLVAEALDIPLEWVNITPPDTLTHPYDWGSTGSRSTYAMGAAVLAAAEEAKQKLFKQAAPKLDAEPAQMETRDGMVYVRGRDGIKLPWAAIMGWDRAIIGEGHFPGRYNIPAYQVHFAEVEVDVETGETRLLELVSSTNCGQIIDPLSLQGQLQGFHPGAGLTLREETVLDATTGRMLNANMIDYKTLTFSDLPGHRFVILEIAPQKADPPCPFGAFGVGEVSLAPAIPAVSMAIYNAIGKRFFEYPITPDKILKALGRTR